MNDISAKGYKKEVIESNIPVLLECWASWCLPCKQNDITLKKLSDEYKGKCKVMKINIDINPTISKICDVRGLPTFITYLNGKEYERKAGSRTDEQIIDMIENVIQKYNSKNNEEEENEIIEQRLKDLGYL